LLSYFSYFQVDPAETYLRDNITSSSYFPQANGTFRLIEEGVTEYTTLIVEGRESCVRCNSSSEPSTAATSYGSTLSLSSTQGPSGNSSSPAGFHTQFRSVMPMKRERAVPASQSHTLKLVRAKMQRRGRKIQFKETGQAFIQLTESTTNVRHIINMASQEWREDHSLALVTQDGLQINHSIATQGLNII